MSNLAQMFLISYTTVKDLLPLKVASKNKFLLLAVKITTISLAIVLLLTEFAFILPFALFRFCLYVTLKIAYGQLYGGFLSGLDCLFETDASKTVVNVVQIFSSKDGLSAITDSLQECFTRVHNCSYKFSSNIQNVLGYCFFVKNQVKIEDVIEVVRCSQDEFMSREMLLDYLHENCVTLKKNQMWTVTLFAQPIRWNDNYDSDGSRQYVAIYTLRHSLCDGPAIVTLFRKYIAQDAPPGSDANASLKTQKVPINLDNVMIRRNPFTTKVDGLALKIQGNRDWHIATFFEDKPRYVPVIKKIKDKLDVRFTEVLSAAVACSVNDYVKQRNAKLDNFTIGSVIRLKIEDLIKLQQGIYTFEDVSNNFGLVGLTLPFNLEERNMRNVIEYIHGYNESLRYSVDPLVAYSFLRDVCTYLPIKLTKYFCESFMNNMTIGVTNLVGFERCTCKGNPVEDIFFFVPGFLNTGFIFNIFSYDGRLQITLTSREGFVYNREELQEILNNALKYLAKAEKEILASSTL